MSTIGTTTFCALQEGSVVISRPLHELKNHITHFEVPNLALLIRVVKTCVMSFFRGHFYDTNFVCVKSSLNFIYSMKGKVEINTWRDLEFAYPHMLESGMAFQPNSKMEGRIQFTNLQQLKSITLDTIFTYYRDQLDVAALSAVPSFWNNESFRPFYLTKEPQSI